MFNFGEDGAVEQGQLGCRLCQCPPSKLLFQTLLWRMNFPFGSGYALVLAAMHPECTKFKDSSKTVMGKVKKIHGLDGRRGGTRTPDPRIRNPLLYPPELHARGAFSTACGYA